MSYTRAGILAFSAAVLAGPWYTDVVQVGLQQPTMWITRDAKTMQLEGWPQKEIDEPRHYADGGRKSAGKWLFRAGTRDVPRQRRRCLMGRQVNTLRCSSKRASLSSVP